MPRGGRRPGAGRKRNPKPTVFEKFDLIGRLKGMEAGEAGLTARVCFSLAFYGASITEIAAVLDRQTDEVVLRFRESLAIGTMEAQANFMGAMRNKARAGNYQAIVWCLRQMEANDASWS